MSFNLDLTRPLESLFQDLEQATEYDLLLLQRTIYLLPSLRHERNVSLLIRAFMLSKGTTPNLQELRNVQANIDGILAAVDRKSKITDPTIPLDKWVALINSACSLVVEESWRAMPMLTALILTNANIPPRQRDTAKRLLIRISYACIDAGSIKRLAAFTLARAHRRTSIAEHTDSRWLLNVLKLVYLDEGGLTNGYLSCSDLQQNIVWVFLSDFSHFIQECAEHTSDPMILDEALNYIMWFASSTSDECKVLFDRLNKDIWDKLKLVMFALSIQLRGIAAQLLLSKNRAISSSAYFASKIIFVLSPVYFIIQELGLGGGFSEYNFVYLTSIDIITENANKRELKELEQSIRHLAGTCNIGSVETNFVERGKVIYLLDLFEHIVHLDLGIGIVDSIILPTTTTFLNPKTTNYETIRPVFESAHCVMLAYLKSPRKHSQSALIPSYFESVMSYFPLLLSPGQLNLSLQTIANILVSVSYDANDSFSTRHMGEVLYEKCLNTKPGIPLNSDSKEDTMWGVLVSSLIHILPYLHFREFTHWLTVIESLIRKGTPEEKKKLDHEFWVMVLEELGPDKQELGFRWWHSMRPNL